MAISEASYSRGNRVYGGGSSAPTRGTVDPMGYINRSLNAPSQARSGLASAALSRLQQRSQPVSDQQAPAQPHAQAQAVGYSPMPQKSYQVQANGRLAFNRPNMLNATGREGAHRLGAGANTPQPRVMEPADNSSFPFDAQAAAAAAVLKQQQDQQLNELLRLQQNTEENYTVNRRDAEIERPDQLRSLLNNFSGRGMAYSSGYGHSLGESNNDFANFLAELERGRTNSINDILGRRTDTEANYKAQLQALQAEAARRLAERAGDLGLSPVIRGS